MFAAAKTQDVLSKRVHLNNSFGFVRGLKKLFQKKIKNYCGNKKRVLYLHPLNEETS